MVEARQRASTVVIGRSGKNIINYLEGQPTYQNKKFEDVLASNKCDNDGIAANDQYCAVTWSGKGQVVVFGAQDFKRFQPGTAAIRCHNGDVTDIQFSPHAPNLLATGCLDGLVRFFQIEDPKGYSAHVDEPDAALDATRKILSMQWHKQAENLLATSTLDNMLKIWDVTGNGEAGVSVQDLPGNLNNIQWSLDGKSIAGTCKNISTAVVLDPRDPETMVSIDSKLTGRSSRIQWVNDDTLLVTGFDGTNKRAWSLLDLRNTSAPMRTGQLSAIGTSAFFPYYDPGLNFFVVSGRGDSQAEFYAYDNNSEALIDKVSSYKFNDVTQFFSMLPKQSVDCNTNEVARCVRIGQKKHLEYFSFKIPSRIGGYNKDYYPPFVANVVSSQATDWISGNDVEQKTMVLEPSKTTKAGFGGLGKKKLGGGGAADSANQEDTEALKKQIADLQAEVASMKAATSAASGSEDLSSKPELGYWKIRGLAQPIRVMLAYCGVEFEDKMYDVTGEPGNWDRSAWTDVKFSLGLEYPNLPYLVDGETKLTETVAIMKYIAKKWDASLLGTSAAQMGRTEMLFAHVMKMKELCTLPCYMGQKEGDDLKDQIVEDCQPILEKIMEVSEGKAWLTGETLTWLDFFFAEVLEYLEVILDERFVALVPSSHDYLEKFKGVEKVKAYMDSEACMKKPFNNKMAVLGQDE